MNDQHDEEARLAAALLEMASERDIALEEVARLRGALQSIVSDRRTSPTAWEIAKNALRTTSASTPPVGKVEP